MGIHWMLTARAWASRTGFESLATARFSNQHATTALRYSCLKVLTSRHTIVFHPAHSIYRRMACSSTDATTGTELAMEETHCAECNRKFSSPTALQEHLKDPSQHANPHCSRCNKSFESKDALQKHIRESAKRNICDKCPGKPDFRSAEKLAKHTKEVHQERETPLDRFFLSFPQFKYDPSLPPATSYHKLQKHMNWKKGDDDSDKAWSRYQEALKDEVRVWFGHENDLLAWHTLCKAIGITKPPESIKKCEQVSFDSKFFFTPDLLLTSHSQRVRNTHVNIVDLIHWGRIGDSEKRVKVFNIVQGLREYTIKTGKVFPQRDVEIDGESNIVLRHLLRYIF